MVGDEADLYVEALRPVDVGDRDRRQFDPGTPSPRHSIHASIGRSARRDSSSWSRDARARDRRPVRASRPVADRGPGLVAALIEVGEVFLWIRFLRRYRVTTGAEGMVGERAEVIGPGRVRVRGEIWSARGRGDERGETVRVAAVDGLTLVVEPEPRRNRTATRRLRVRGRLAGGWAGLGLLRLRRGSRCALRRRARAWRPPRPERRTDDRLVGTKGDDVLEGLRRRDLLIGGGGRDVLIGGGGPRRAARRRRGARQLQHARRGRARRPGAATGSTPATATPTRSTAAPAATSRSSTRSRTGVYDCEGVQRSRDRRARRPLVATRARRARRPRAAERLEAEHRDELLRRREFLGRTAALAGLAGMAGVLPAETLVAEAAQAGGPRSPLPKPRDLPIDTFVVLMMENRSFDHYFGWHPRADGRNEGLSYPNLDGSADVRDPSPDARLPGLRLPRPRPRLGRRALPVQRRQARRLLQRQRRGHRVSDEYALGYYLRRTSASSRTSPTPTSSTTATSARSSASTYPNRHYQLAAQNGARSRTCCRRRRPSTGFEWETILDRALAHGIGVGYYVSDLPVPALYGPRGLAWVRPVAQFYTDAAAGDAAADLLRRPAVPDGGGGDGVSADEHPHGDVRLGQAFMSDVAHAFIESPQYRRGAMFINYDEWGGFFDHVKPRRVPDDRANRADLDNDWSITGFRVPAVAISPVHARAAQARAGQPHDLHPRVDPEADLLPLRARLPDQAPPLRLEHRPQLRLLQARPRAARAARPGGDRRGPVLGRRQRGARSSTTWSGSRPRACSTGSATRSRRSTYDSLFRYPDRVRRAFEA